MKLTRIKQYPEPRIAPYLKRRKPKRHWFEDIRLWRKFELGLGIIVILALGASIYGNYQAYEALQLTEEGLNEARQQAKNGLEQTLKEAEESRIINAWQILSNRSPSNIGKKTALETLHKAEENLRGIDLSCKTMGGMDEKTESCDTPTLLTFLSLPNVNLPRANLSDANLYMANLINANLSLANLSGASLFLANLSGANLLGANLDDADLRETNLSNVHFCSPRLRLPCAENLTQAQIDAAWAWADSPPVFNDGGEHRLDLAPPPLCSVELRPKYEADKEIEKPLAC